VKRFLTALPALLLTSCASHADPAFPIQAGAETPIQISGPQEDLRARLAEWLRLVAPDPTITATEYASFLQKIPHWPDRALMQSRLQHALATRADPAELTALCPTISLTYGPALLACTIVSPVQTIAPRARTAWIGGIDRSDDEQSFLATFGRYFTANDQWRRFQRQLSGMAISAATRQIPRLPPARQPLAHALLAYRARSDAADTFFAALTDQDKADPQLTLYRLHALRRADRLDDALALWNSTGFAQQQAQPSAAWSNERAATARALLMTNRPSDALPLADDQTLPPGNRDRLEADFLTGWISLRFMHDAARAATAFEPLTRDPALLTRSRGWYWLGRAREALSDPVQAHQAYTIAATLPTTFYGQLALARLANPGTTTLAITPQLLAPALSTLAPAKTASTSGRDDLVQAATLLISMNDQPHARDFLMMLEAEARTDQDRAAVATLALRLNMPEPAIYAARASGKNGTALYPTGWPNAFPVPASSLPDDLVRGVMRQESSFNPAIVSPAGAIGLMQLIPGAAKDVARKNSLHLDTSPQGLRNPETNAALGEAYLSNLLQRFGGVVPYALAAYNAGPHRVDQWIAPGAPSDADALLDWIERVPYEETRSYIERIEESAAIYRVEATHAG